jgi:hypothetical protein
MDDPGWCGSTNYLNYIKYSSGMASSCMSSSSSLNYSMYEPNDTCNKRYTKFVELVIVFVVLYYSSWLNLYVVDGLAKKILETSSRKTSQR